MDQAKRLCEFTGDKDHWLKAVEMGEAVSAYRHNDRRLYQAARMSASPPSNGVQPSSVLPMHLTNRRTLHYHPGRRVIRRRRRGRRIRTFPNITLVVRAFADVACALGHPVPGVADAHIPLHTLVWPTSIQV
jgi:hypothetical protein